MRGGFFTKFAALAYGAASKTKEFHEKLWNGIEINEKLQIKTCLFEFCLPGPLLTKVQKISKANFLVLISSKKTSEILS